MLFYASELARQAINCRVQTGEGGHSGPKFLYHSPNSSRPASRDGQGQGQEVMLLLLPGPEILFNDSYMPRQKNVGVDTILRFRNGPIKCPQCHRQAKETAA